MATPGSCGAGGCGGGKGNGGGDDKEPWRRNNNNGGKGTGSMISNDQKSLLLCVLSSAENDDDEGEEDIEQQRRQQQQHRVANLSTTTAAVAAATTTDEDNASTAGTSITSLRLQQEVTLDCLSSHPGAYSIVPGQPPTQRVISISQEDMTSSNSSIGSGGSSSFCGDDDDDDDDGVQGNGSEEREEQENVRQDDDEGGDDNEEEEEPQSSLAASSSSSSNSESSLQLQQQRQQQQQLEGATRPLAETDGSHGSQQLRWSRVAIGQQQQDGSGSDSGVIRYNSGSGDFVVVPLASAVPDNENDHDRNNNNSSSTDNNEGISGAVMEQLLNDIGSSEVEDQLELGSFHGSIDGSIVVHAKAVNKCGYQYYNGWVICGLGILLGAAAILAITLGALGLGFTQEQQQDRSSNTPSTTPTTTTNNNNLSHQNTTKFCSVSGRSCWRQLGPDLKATMLGQGFGASVSLSSMGDRVAVSSIYSLGPAETNPGSGLVQVYDINTARSSDDGTTTTATLTQVGEDLYGLGYNGTLPDHSVAKLSGNGQRLIVTNLGSDFAGVKRPNTGGEGWFEPSHAEVNVYELDESSNMWVRVGDPIINHDETIKRFGFPVDISEDGRTVLIGSNTNGAICGHVYTQDNNIASSQQQWIQLGESMGDDIPETTSDNSQIPVPGVWLRLSADGRSMVMSSFLTNSVSLYEFQSSSSSSSWVKVGTQIKGSGGTSGSFGTCVTLAAANGKDQQTTIAIGDPLQSQAGYHAGNVQVFRPHKTNGTDDPEGKLLLSWEQVGDDINGEGLQDSIHRVELDATGSRVVTSSFANPEGYIRVYDKKRPDGVDNFWKMVGGEIIGPSGGGFDFGFSISLARASGNRLVVGGPAWGMNEFGIVRLYELVEEE